jgi:putative two-component system response regulator
MVLTEENSMKEKLARILITDDVPANAKLIACLLPDYNCSIATSGPEALEKMALFAPDLVFLDVVMPGMDGFEVCKAIKSIPAYREIPVVMVTSLDDRTSKIHGLEVGANEFLTKPIDTTELRLRTSNLLKVKEYGDFLAQHNTLLQDKLAERTKELEDAYGEIISRLATAAEYKDTDTGLHILRISEYTRALAKISGLSPVEQTMYAQASPMHDIGKIGIPDNILLKPGPLDPTELIVMQSHTLLGERILAGSNSPLLKLAQLVARNHHERWDGSGYPSRLSGDTIPPVARFVAIADQYDALRSLRPYKGSLDHCAVVNIIAHGDGRTRPEHFDPQLLQLFLSNHKVFGEIYSRFTE